MTHPKMCKLILYIFSSWEKKNKNQDDELGELTTNEDELKPKSFRS